MAGSSIASINGSNSNHHHPSASSNTISALSMNNHMPSSTPTSLSISIQSNNNNNNINNSSNISNGNPNTNPNNTNNINNSSNGHININRNASNIPQVDGPVDSSQQQILNEASNDDELGSDLDDDRDEEAELNELEDFVLCTYEKVTRTKNKWRGILKNGIVHIRGRDYVFNRANFEFEW